MQNSANTTADSAGAAASFVAKPLNELTETQRKKVTSELQRIHSLVSTAADKDVHKDSTKDKA